MVEEDNERLIIGREFQILTTCMVKVKEVNRVNRRTRKMHLSLQAEEAQVIVKSRSRVQYAIYTSAQFQLEPEGSNSIDN